MRESAKEFKWFGEGFDGFPKILPEDCVEYAIYIIDQKLSDSEARERLREVLKIATSFIRDLLRDFIWQRERFTLSLERDSDRSFLRGRTNFGDSSDDEWTIVYILRELSRKCPDIWIRTVDNDGEFLLIEAADVLPLWLNPEVADFRVWIHGGQLLILPLDSPRGNQHLADESDRLSLEQVLCWIGDPDKRLHHSLKLEAEAFARLRQYPEQIRNSLHSALVTIPRKLAYMIHNHPRSITAATEAFYLRDPISLNLIKQEDTKNVLFSPVDLVTSSVKFTKIGYAQLKTQQFAPPRVWADTIKPFEGPEQRQQLEVGMKLACGFEMLLRDDQNQDRSIVQELKLLIEDLASGEVTLPSDEDIRTWGLRQDDESWLDINFEDFERELAGKAKPSGDRAPSGFSDRSAHAKLQRTVQKFENFLAQEADAGSMGLIDEMDKDDDDSPSDAGSDLDDDSVSDTKNESKTLSNEDDFTIMMRELMDMPSGVMKEIMHGVKDEGEEDPASGDLTHPRGERSEQPSREFGDFERVMAQAEKELQDAGVLDV